MLNFGICASIVSALIAGNISTAPAPTVWGVYGALDASRLYCVVFDDNNTDSIEDDSILLAVAMD